MSYRSHARGRNRAPTKAAAAHRERRRLAGMSPTITRFHRAQCAPGPAWRPPISASLCCSGSPPRTRWLAGCCRGRKAWSEGRSLPTPFVRVEIHAEGAVCGQTAGETPALPVRGPGLGDWQAVAAGSEGRFLPHRSSGPEFMRKLSVLTVP